jgi:hypothetical protein
VSSPSPPWDILFRFYDYFRRFSLHYFGDAESLGLGPAGIPHRCPNACLQQLQLHLLACLYVPDCLYVAGLYQYCQSAFLSLSSSWSSWLPFSSSSSSSIARPCGASTFLFMWFDFSSVLNFFSFSSSKCVFEVCAIYILLTWLKLYF